jgi:hypothetical protein
VVNANSNTTSIQFEYGTSTGYGTAKPLTPLSATGSGNTPVVTTLTSLNPGTLYHARVVATNAVGTTYGGDMVFSTDGMLTVTFSGNGSGSVTGAAQGYVNTSCDKGIPGSCTPSAYAAGTLVSLSAYPDWKSAFVNWNGVDSNSAGNASLTLETNRTVTVTFNPIYKVSLSPVGTPFASIQDAYNAATTGGTIQAQDYSFAEGVEFAGSSIVEVTLKGGMDALYKTVTGYSTVQKMTIRSGKVNVRNVKIMK